MGLYNWNSSDKYVQILHITKLIYNYFRVYAGLTIRGKCICL